MKRALILFTVLAPMCVPMSAQELPTSEFHGYIRAGSGRSTQGGNQVAFGLPGYSKFRLGNEAENYGELEWDAKVYDTDAATFKVHTMAQFANNFSDGTHQQGTGTGVLSNADGTTLTTSGRNFDMAQYWVEAKGVLGSSDAFKDASLWIGKRYYNRNDVHIMDFFYWNNQGNGGGIENIDLGVGKLSYAYMQSDTDSDINPATLVPKTQNIIGSHDLRLSDIPANPGGKFMVGIEYQEARPYGGTNNNRSGADNNGVTFDVMHIQSGVWGGENKLTLQYGTGASAGTTGSALSNSPNASLTSDNKAWRVVEMLNVQPNDSFGMQGVIVYQSSKDAASNKTTWTAIGARPTFFVTKHFSVAADLGFEKVKYDTGSDLKLNKETLALQWSPKPEFWSRPQMRLFVTNAQWNDATTAAGMANGTFGTKTSGTTYGMQTEIWW